MKIEIRASGGPACSDCGATELIHSNGQPLARDLTRVLETEILRREVGVMRMLRDHLTAAETDHASELKDLQYELTRQHTDLLGSVRGRLKVDVSKWHALRRRRELAFAARVEAVFGELVDATKHGT